MKKWKIIAIGLVANTIENLLLLTFLKVQINQQILLGSGVFALVTILLMHILNKGE